VYTKKPNIPKQIGGILIRHLVKEFKSFGLELPLKHHCVIGVSGGADSLALAVLLTKYGRRIIDPKKVIWLHVNHGWRGVESDEDAKAVKVIGQKLGAQVIVKTVSSRTLQQFKKRLT
jgi:tRNA(Ile)-lysidine synthase TilS/MesJ